MGRVPVIAMTGHKPPSMQHRNAYQEIPHAPLFAPVTKFSARVDQAADLPRLMRLAWREAMTGTPRPAHLDLNGLQAEVIENGHVSETPAAEPVFQMTLPPHRPIASSVEIERAAERILRANKVVIVAGEGATASGAGKELLALAELLAAPIATSLGARGLVPTRHRLSVGCAGSYAAPPANQIVHEAELVVFIGCETGDQVTHTWRIPAIDTPCVQIDLDPTDIGRSYPNTTGVMGDPKSTVAALILALGRPTRDTAFADRAAGIMSAWRQSRAAALGSNATPIWPDRLCDEITACPARRWHSDRRHRLFQHLEQFADRTERRRADVSTRRRVAWLVLPGGIGREMRGAATKNHLLVRRRGTVLPPDGTGNRAAQRDRGGPGGQQQLRFWPRLAEHPATARQ